MAIEMRTDTDIHRDVLEEVEWDPRLAASELGVEVDDGVVTLTGTVDSYVKKLAAQRAAFRVAGVRAVANDLTIHIPGKTAPNDTDIAQAAVDMLEANSLVPAEELRVVVNHGRVILTGTVEWEFQRKAAEDTVRNLRGVHAVSNDVVIWQPMVSAREIEAGIERALVRAAEVNADRSGCVVNGNVRLTGSVSSWAERKAAGSAAWRAKGVTSVTNDLVI